MRRDISRRKIAVYRQIYIRIHQCGIIKRLHNHSRYFDQRAYGHIKSEKDIVLFGVGLGFSRGTAAAVAVV